MFGDEPLESRPIMLDDAAEDAQADGERPDETPELEELTSGNWRYTGPPPGRIYTNVPVTVTTGDIITWPQAPADDGAWEPTGDDATKQPDNHRPESIITPTEEA